MMFDNSPPTDSPQKIVEGLAMAALGSGAFIAAIGMHVASLTATLIGIGLLCVGGLAVVARGRGNRKAGRRS